MSNLWRLITEYKKTMLRISRLNSKQVVAKNDSMVVDIPKNPKAVPDCKKFKPLISSLKIDIVCQFVKIR